MSCFKAGGAGSIIFGVSGLCLLGNVKFAVRLPCAWIDACKCVQKSNRELKRERFWDADGNWKLTNFAFNLPSHNYIHTAKFIFSITDQ